MKKLNLTKKKIARGMLGMFMVLMIVVIGMILGRYGGDPAFNSVPGVLAIILTVLFLIVIMIVVEKVIVWIVGKDLFDTECPCEFCKIPELQPGTEILEAEGIKAGPV